ncbi:hemoglobin [Hoeflea marina]|uniref:Hemoglobin n=1 Tax=Hoeflea marina TaxID=274592 RepID=A0A317PG07_9HYPH|nr:group III truncated hemoglobin [Hoeflea marina]PWV99131.1 hemoglobin [Hoeflea marina]
MTDPAAPAKTTVELIARAAPPRRAGLDLSDDAIARLVDQFYSDIRDDPRLGPLFESRLAGQWPEHLRRMNQFWRSVLNHSGEYYGQPVVKHNGLPGLEEDDFRIWIGLFEATSARLFAPDVAAAILTIARRIARSLWLARFGTPFNRSPAWLD